MADLDLRPLSLGEILDRSFTLYRRHFGLFVGIAAIPQLLVIALNLAQTFLRVRSPLAVAPGSVVVPAANPAAAATSIVIGLLTIVVTLIAYLLTQGATVSAVADLYLGRATSIGDSFQKIRGDLGTLFGVVVLNGFVTMLAFILLIVPGIYMMCRLLIAVPAAVIENLGPRDSLERSFALTKGSAGRAFMILLLYFVLLIAAIALFTWPASLGLAAARGNPSMVRVWTAIVQIATSIAGILVVPILLTTASVLYFDLRVRKEAFDLQVMMNPEGAISSPARGVSNVLS